MRACAARRFAELIITNPVEGVGLRWEAFLRSEFRPPRSRVSLRSASDVFQRHQIWFERFPDAGPPSENHPRNVSGPAEGAKGEPQYPVLSLQCACRESPGPAS